MKVLPVDREYLDSMGKRDGIAFVLAWDTEKELLEEVEELLKEIVDLLSVNVEVTA